MKVIAFRLTPRRWSPVVVVIAPAPVRDMANANIFDMAGEAITAKG